MKIAIIGTGISGLVAAYRLQHDHDITVFESAGQAGGHTATVDVDIDGERHAIDTGFIVFNDWTYPNFIALMDELGVASRQSDMSFGVNCYETGLAYAGVDGRLALYNSLFAQRRRLFSPVFIGMLLDILRFNRIAEQDVLNGTIPDITLQEYVAEHRLGDMFRDYYLVPMASAIWSTPFRDMLDFPIPFMLPFIHAHGLINIHDQPK
jgi:predicted NAD/FAD-binding protein